MWQAWDLTADPSRRYCSIENMWPMGTSKQMSQEGFYVRFQNYYCVWRPKSTQLTSLPHTLDEPNQPTHRFTAPKSSPQLFKQLCVMAKNRKKSWSMVKQGEIQVGQLFSQRLICALIKSFNVCQRIVQRQPAELLQACLAFNCVFVDAWRWLHWIESMTSESMTSFQNKDFCCLKMRKRFSAFKTMWLWLSGPYVKHSYDMYSMQLRHLMCKDKKANNQAEHRIEIARVVRYSRGRSSTKQSLLNLEHWTFCRVIYLGE